MISVKIYKQGEDILLVACDEHLLGKKIEEGKFHLDIRQDFYDGQHITVDDLKRYLEMATIANLVGEEAVQYAIELGFVDPSCVLRIQGVPHAQMVKML
jgi:hypothetical protein